MKQDTPHLIMNLKTGDMECLHCGTKQPVSYPIGIPIILAMMKAFKKIHKGCKPPTLHADS